MTTLDSLNNTLEIGAVFTPRKWAKFAIERFDLFDKWIKGASIFDPTMGEGGLLLALIERGMEKGFSPDELPIGRLYGVELNKNFFDSVFDKAKKLYGINLPVNNYWNEDIFFQNKERAFDILFGNPPWQNFVDLPEEYKSKIKGHFFLYDLVGNAQNLLLGGSRIDIAALVLQKTIQKNLIENGEAVFFVPLSLFLNDGANKFFRKYKVNGVEYCVRKILDFNDLEIFDGVATRYGLIHILRNKKQVFPVEYERWEKNQWVRYGAKPLIRQDDPLSVLDYKNGVSFELQPISVKKSSQPRQGINTCGANRIFFFDMMKTVGLGTCEVANKYLKAVLPKQYIYPVITSKNFLDENPSPRKWILLPYNEKTGKPLNSDEIKKEYLLWKYLREHEKELRDRKGTLINVWIRRGIWWALLGVGGYNFYPYKIVWEAYGRTSFLPKIFSGRWQANQSLQAFMPMTSREEATKVLKLLSGGDVERYLLSHKMGGTMNWAQPGKIKKLLKFEEEPQALLPTF